MSARLTDMHDFIETLCRRTPHDLHTCRNAEIHDLFDCMRVAIDDPAAVLRLAGRLRAAVAQELRFEAENAERARAYPASYKLRRHAERFEAAHV
jgi:hypothetical protein